MKQTFWQGMRCAVPFLFLGVLIAGCSTTPKLEVVAPGLTLPGQTELSAAIVIPEPVMGIKTVTKLPTLCWANLNYLPVSYGELFENTVRDRFSRLFSQITILRSQPSGGTYDMVYEATMTDVAARGGCLLSPESYALVKGGLTEFDHSGREIWRSSITSGRADTQFQFKIDDWTGQAFSNAIAIMVDDWMREVAAAALEKPEPAKIARSTSPSGASASMIRSSAGAQPVASGPDLPEGVYTLESKIDFNVLDKVFFDPKTGTVSLIGHRDSRYGSSRIPYLQHLAALLDQPHPQISLDWTPESERRIADLFRRMDSTTEMGRLTAQSAAGSWFGSDGLPTQKGRRMFRMIGITPPGRGPGDPWQGMTRIDVVATLLDNAGDQRGANILRGLKDFQRGIRTSQGGQALVDFLAIADAEMSRTEAIDLYNQLVGEVRQGRRSKESALAILFRKLLAGMEQGLQFSGGSLTNIFDREMARREDAGRAYDVAAAEANRQMKTMLRRALEIVLRRNEEVVMPITDVEAELGAKPVVVPRFVGLDPRSQLARVMFEADYLGKSLLFKPDLKKKIPRYKTEYAFYADRAGGGPSGATIDRRMWISIDELDLVQSSDGSTLETRGAKMRFNVRDVQSGRTLAAERNGYGALLTSLYDDFAVEFSILHELREAAKFAGVARWIKAKAPHFRLPSNGRAVWEPPRQVPGFIYLIWSPHRVNVVMAAPGGVELVPPPSDIFVDSTVVDLRPDRLIAAPEVGPAILSDIVGNAPQVPIPRPVGWITKGKADGKDITAVSVVITGSERDAPTTMRLGSSLEEQAAILWKISDLEGAEQAYRKLLHPPPDDPWKAAALRLLLAQVLHEIGDDAAAIKELNEALRLAPDHPLVHLLLAKALADSGDLPGAQEALRRYVALEPQNKAATKLLGELSATQTGATGKRIGGTAPAPGSTPAPPTARDSVLKKLASVVYHGLKATRGGPKGAAKKETERGFDRSGKRVPLSSGGVVDVRGVPPGRDIRPGLAKKPAMIRLQQQKRQLLQEHRDLEKQLEIVKEKKARGEGDKGQLDLQEVELNQKKTETMSRIGAVQVKIESYIVEFEEEPRQKSEEGTTPKAGKAETGPPQAAPPRGK